MVMNEKVVGMLGLLSVLLLFAVVFIFGFLNAEFSFAHDFISKLGATGEPYALWFNLFGFILVGVLLFAFGLGYGSLLHDNLLSMLLSLFGVGFAFTAIPIDMQMADSPVSKAHIIAICLGLASWLFGLSRLGSNKQLRPPVRTRANIAAVTLVLSMIGFVLGLWSMPITHRLVFGVVFGWTVWTSIELLLRESENK